MQENEQSKVGASLRTMAQPAAPKSIGMAAPSVMLTTQSPVLNNNVVRYHVANPSRVQIVVFDVTGKALKVLVNKQHEAGDYTVQWNTSGISKGNYLFRLVKMARQQKPFRL